MGFFENLFGGDKPRQQHNPPAPPPLPPPQHEKVKQEPFPPGSVLLGKYEIIRKLGEGGFGVVLLAKGKPTEPLIALKVVRSDLGFAPDVPQRFKKEAGIWINMDVHPNIVQAHFFEAVGGQMVIGIDYIEPDANGFVTLADHIRRGIELKQLVIWATDICKGMSHAFSKGLKAHRDLKPTNILISDAGPFKTLFPAWHSKLAKVSDFGLAGSAEPQSAMHQQPNEHKVGATIAGEISGTPAYMAPEQFDGLIHCSERSDVYSFGLILYECVNGRLPVRPNPNCRNGKEIWADFAQQHRIKVFPKVDSILWPVIAKCIQKNPADRFGSFAEITAQLNRVLVEKFGVDPTEQPFAIVRDEQRENHFQIVVPVNALGRQEYDLASKAASLSRAGDFTGAMEHIERALKTDPANAVFRRIKAGILRGESFEIGISIGDYARDERGLANKAASLSQLGDHAGALWHIEKALKMDPNNAGFLMNKASILARAKSL